MPPRFFAVSQSLMCNVTSANNSAGYKTDHSLIADTTQLLTTSNFIGPWYHAPLLFSGLGSIVLLFVLLFPQQIREDLVRAAYRADRHQISSSLASLLEVQVSGNLTLPFQLKSFFFFARHFANLVKY